MYKTRVGESYCICYTIEVRLAKRHMAKEDVCDSLETHSLQFRMLHINFEFQCDISIANVDRKMRLRLLMGKEVVMRGQEFCRGPRLYARNGSWNYARDLSRVSSYKEPVRI